MSNNTRLGKTLTGRLGIRLESIYIAAWPRSISRPTSSLDVKEG